MKRADVVNAVVTEVEQSQTDLEVATLENLAYRLGILGEVNQVLYREGWLQDEEVNNGEEEQRHEDS